MNSGKIGPQILMIQQYELEFSLHLYKLSACQFADSLWPIGVCN